MSESLFEKGLKVNVTEHIEKKGKFSYLSWPFAVQELRKLDPKATWEVRHFSEGSDDTDIWGDATPYMRTDCGHFVEVVVTMGDGTKSQQIHPVLDNYNKPIKEPNAFQINTSIQRCLVKAIALASGIGLHIYAGEDLPPSGIDKEQQEQQAISIDTIKQYLPNCKTEAELTKYYNNNKGFIDGLFKDKKQEIVDAFASRKKEIKGD